MVEALLSLHIASAIERFGQAPRNVTAATKSLNRYGKNFRQ